MRTRIDALTETLRFTAPGQPSEAMGLSQTGEVYLRQGDQWRQATEDQQEEWLIEMRRRYRAGEVTAVAPPETAEGFFDRFLNAEFETEDA